MTSLDGILRTNAPSRAPPRTNKYVPLVVGTSKKVARSVWTANSSLPKRNAQQETIFRFDFFLTRLLHIQVRLKNHRKPYLRYLWIDSNITENEINHLKNTIYKHNINFFFQKVIQGQMIVNFIFLNCLVYFCFDFERDYFSESNDMPHVRMRLIVIKKINK
jgi:hypothetical protein